MNLVWLARGTVASRAQDPPLWKRGTISQKLLTKSREIEYSLELTTVIEEGKVG